MHHKPQSVVVEAVALAASNWHRAESAVSQILRNARQLGSRDRRWVGETVWGIIRNWRLVEYLAGANPSIEQRIATYQGLPNVDRNALLADISDPIERAALRFSLPTWLYREWVADEGHEEAAACAQALLLRAPLCIRANLLRTSREALVKRLQREGVSAEQTQRASTGLILSGHPNIRALNAWREGCFEVQDEGSQIVAEFVDPPSDGVIVDACAGAGGKTLALAALAPHGRVVASDIDGRRLRELAERAQRAHATNVSVGPPELADRVLLDVPCSGTGVLGRHPALRWAITPDQIPAFHARQVDLAVRHAEFVRTGGQLIYATCSLLRSENEMVVDEIARRTSFRVRDSIKLWPHRDHTDGFFAASLVR